MPCPSRSPLSESRVSVSLLAVLVLCLHMALIPSHAPAMELPAGQDHILYEPIAAPVASDDPSVARPIGLGSVAVSGSVLRVEIELTRFSGPADIFVGVYAPAVDDDALYMLRPDNVLQPHTQGVVPWKERVLIAGGESPFGEIAVSSLPPGRYTLYLAVTPPGDLTRYVLWETGFTVAARPSGLRAPRLQSLGTCDKVAESIRERLVLEMEKNVDLLKENVSTYGWCTPVYIAFSAGGVPSPPSPSAPVYSETNVQVPGVDEADFMKNDGAYIYILADGRFQIVEAWPPETSRVIASAAVEGTPKKLFVAADRALVYSSLGPLDTGTYYFPGPSSPIVGPFEAPECVYGYDCDFTGDGRGLKMTVFDISDRTRPRLEREIRLDGSLLNARRIGTAVHTAVIFPPSPPTWSELVNECFAISECRLSWVPMDPCVTDRKAWIDALEGLKDFYRRQIASRTAEELLPKITDIWYEGNSPVGATQELQCDGFFAPPEPDGQSFLSLVSLDMATHAGSRQTTILGRPGVVYASSDSLYVASRYRYDPVMPWFFPPGAGSPREASTVHRFSLRSNPAGSAYVGSGVIEGRVLNQFSLDEYNGHLRVATTTGHSPAPDTRSTVSVLREAGGELSLVGQLDGIAPSEDIRSARFFGDRGLIVTFKKTDPLFAIDLRDPLRPAIAGELKIPGFSTYMHFMDDRHLLSIGYDAEDMGAFSLFQGIMLQIFDVGDLAVVPRLLHKEVIGTRGTTSEAATNHLAFNYFKAKDLLALPATVCEGGSAGSFYGTSMTFSGLLVYKATVQGGFARLGGVPHVAPGSGQSPQMCGSWWTVPNSVVKRSVFMDDYVYSVASDLIKVDSVNALGTDVSVIDLTTK